MHVALLAVLTLAGVHLLSGCTRQSRPNVVLITLDTTRADRLGIYGNSPSPSPHLDAFARKSTVYERAYSSSSWTLPSHASIFTGLLPSQHGAGRPDLDRATDAPWRFAPLADEYTTLAELFRGVGYGTAAVIGGPAMSADLGVAQGFEHYDANFATPLEKWHGKRAAYVADRALSLIRDFGEEPYFLFVNFFDPHRPYEPPAGSTRALPPPPANLERELVTKMSLAPVPVATLEESLRSRVAVMLRRYDAEITYMDEHIQRLFDALDDLPLEQRPIVAITSDHGESFGEHYYVAHGGHLYEDLVRVPLIVHDPRRPSEGTRVSSPVQNRQLFATLLAAADIPVPDLSDRTTLAHADGTILTELWRMHLVVALLGKMAERDLRALYVPPYKLIEPSTGSSELYDLDADPGELVNLATERPELVERLRSHLRAKVGEGKPFYESRDRSDLGEDTEGALRALGYLE